MMAMIETNILNLHQDETVVVSRQLWRCTRMFQQQILGSWMPDHLVDIILSWYW